MSVPSALSPFADLFQERTLLRSFDDSLLENFLYDSVSPTAEEWPAHSGLSFTFTNDGYYNVFAAPSPTTIDPSPSSRRAEQYDVTLSNFNGTDDIDATQAQGMLADYAVQTYNRLGINAAATMDAVARGVYTTAATAGWTVADGAQVATTSLRVKRLNGFCANLPTAGTSLRWRAVSGGNPLAILVSGTQSVSVIGFIADNSIVVDQGVGVPDINGPGVLLLSAAVTVADRDPVIAENASVVQRVGDGVNRKTGRIDNVNGPLSYFEFQEAKRRLSQAAVKPRRDMAMNYLVHVSPSGYQQLQNDPAYQRLNFARGIEELAITRGVVGMVSQMLFVENNNAPSADTVNWRTTPEGPRTPATYGTITKDGVAKVSTDPIGIEVLAGVAQDRQIDTTVVFGDDATKRYWQPHPLLGDVAKLKEIGISGVLAEPFQVVNDSVLLSTSYTSMIMISPRNRTADKFPVTWQSKQSFTVKSDQVASAGGKIRYKRVVAIQSLAS